MARKYTKRGESLYMLVSDDKYELPIAVSASVHELARKCNVKEGTIWNNIQKDYGRFIRISTKENDYGYAETNTNAGNFISS